MSGNDLVDGFLAKWKTPIAAAWCCFAVLRVLAFAAAFPLFNPVDETSHYEMVYEYSRGILPGEDLRKVDTAMARIFSLYGSDEYLVSSDVLARFHRDRPLPALPEELRKYYYPRRLGFFLAQSNIETQAPPAYYMLAAVWYKAGEWFGAKDWLMAYWVRFLNAILYGGFVWIAYLFVKEMYPERPFLYAGIPALLAVFPQDVFYGVNRDVLSPPLAGLFLLLLFRALRADTGAYPEMLAAGALAGIAFLTDVSNFVLFGALLAVLLVKSRKAAQLGNPGHEQTMIAASFVAAAALPLLWMARNRVVMGDFSGSHAKLLYLGWITKPWAEMWQHPIFTAAGAWYFVRELIGSYWRGEYVWARGALRNAAAEYFYLYSTLAAITAFLVYFFTRRKQASALERLNGYLSLYLLLASVLFLAGISLLFDFQDCPYPSRAAPYVVSGRIIIGTLLPFLVMYLSGLEFLLRPVRKYVHPIFPLLMICAGILWAEVTVTLAPYHSHFNFYALRNM
jgi:hypothetical protein